MFKKCLISSEHLTIVKTSRHKFFVSAVLARWISAHPTMQYIVKKQMSLILLEVAEQAPFDVVRCVAVVPVVLWHNPVAHLDQCPIPSTSLSKPAAMNVFVSVVLAGTQVIDLHQMVLSFELAYLRLLIHGNRFLVSEIGSLQIQPDPPTPSQCHRQVRKLDQKIMGSSPIVIL